MDLLILTPLLATLFLSVSASILGVLIYLRKEALLSETLSHSAFLGIVLGLVLSHVVHLSLVYPVAFLVSFVALKLVRSIKRELTSDAALCFVLAFFFSLAILCSSLLQTSYPTLMRGANSYLYGSAASVLKSDVWLYAVLAVATIVVIVLFMPLIRSSYFDRQYCESIGFKTKFLDKVIEVLFLLSIVTAIKSVGVVLITAMLITPAIFARLWTKSLATMFCLALLCGAISCLLGLYFSVVYRFSSGPFIVLVSSAFTLVSILISPRGLIARYYRRFCFSSRIQQENILKALYKNRVVETKKNLFSWFCLWLKRQTTLSSKGWVLAENGARRAKLVIRRHRLWEAYLCFKLKNDPRLVHASAERVEHIMNEQIEEGIDMSLDYPKRDPHDQEIFQRESL